MKAIIKLSKALMIFGILAMIAGCSLFQSEDSVDVIETSSAPASNFNKDELTGVVEIDGSSTVYPISEAVAEEFSKEYKKFQKAGIEVVGISKDDVKSHKKFCEKISEMGKYLEDQGMPLAYHHHMGTVIETQNDTERLLDNTHDSVKLTLDTGHMLFAKGDSKKILENYKDRILHVHCKDIRKDVLDKSLKEDLSFRGAFLNGAFTVPGDGCINYQPLFDILKKNNYSGWLVVEAEQDPKKANPLEYAIKGYKYLVETLKKSNIEIEKG